MIDTLTDWLFSLLKAGRQPEYLTKIYWINVIHRNIQASLMLGVQTDLNKLCIGKYMFLIILNTKSRNCLNLSCMLVEGSQDVHHGSGGSHHANILLKGASLSTHHGFRHTHSIKGPIPIVLGAHAPNFYTRNHWGLTCPSIFLVSQWSVVFLVVFW